MKLFKIITQGWLYPSLSEVKKRRDGKELVKKLRSIGIKTNADYKKAWRKAYDRDHKNQYLRLEFKGIRYCDELCRTRYARAIDTLEYFETIPFEYEGDGMDDFSRYQTPVYEDSSCKKLVYYAAFCVGESCNSYKCRDELVCKILERRYRAYEASKKEAV